MDPDPKNISSATIGGVVTPNLPVFRSLALQSMPTPDYADVIVLPVPDGAPADPRVWAEFRCGVAYDAGARLLRVTTVVRLKGWRGRLYFAPVRVLHPLVVHAMMVRTIGRVSRQAGGAQVRRG